MRKKFTILLIMIFVLGLVPVNFSTAISQNLIDAEVQIVCPDNYGNWYSGSGTIIDSKGIILTNKHVVTDEYNNIIKTCAIGFIESVSQEPNFGTNGNINLAEVKYYTTSNDMDAAILYLENPTNKTYPYINIWNSNSSTLELGDKIEVIGFPSIGGSTITYTSGDFSGFGSSSNHTQNYIKTTAPLEHGNSGGGAYNPNGNFVGIPTMVVPGKLNSMSYILSTDSIKNWLTSALGNNYQNQIINNTASPEKNITVQQDLTPPDINKLKGKSYFTYWGSDDNQLQPKDYIKETIISAGDSSNIKIYFRGFFHSAAETRDLNNLDLNNVKYVYYTYSKNLSDIQKTLGTKKILNYDNISLLGGRNGIEVTDTITFNDEGLYYIGLKFEDDYGNISDSFILAYSYELGHKNLQKITYYSDEKLTKPIGEFEYNYSGNRPPIVVCGTSLKNVYAKWQFSKKYEQFMVNLFPKNVESMRRGGVDDVDYDLVTNNTYKLTNIDKGGADSTRNYCYGGKCYDSGLVSSFVLKPYFSDDLAYFDGNHNIVAIIKYNTNLPAKMACGIQGDGYKTNLEIKTIKYNTELSNRLNGQILLQVEEHGEAYYIYPNDNNRYYLGRPTDAFNIMRKLGLGATHDFITSHTIYPANILGKILIDVEQNGEAYYIYPKDKKAYYLGRPADAFKVMRELGLGISNSDLNKIPEGNL